MNAVTPAAHRPWVVAKFGGTSVSTRSRWENIARIAAAHRARGQRVLIVVSALSGVTDLLKRIADSADDEAAARAAQAEIVRRHAALVADMQLADIQETLRQFDRDRPGLDPERAG